MSRLWRALAATAGVVSLGVMGIDGTAYAAAPGVTDIIDCEWTVTAAGNGMPVLSTDFTTVVSELQTGQVFDLFNVTTTQNGVFYWNSSAFIRPGNWYPIRSVGASYMQKVPNSCSNDTQ